MDKPVTTPFQLLQKAFLRFVQTDNRCQVTGIACDPDKCGCQLEMENWIDETN